MDQPELPICVGASGEHVARLQRLLRTHGHYDAAIDSEFGPRTGAGVLAFQRSAGLPATGECDAATWVRLADTDHPFFDPARSDAERLLYLQWPTLQGPDVEELQQRLSILGFLRSRIDGIFGNETQAAVGAFQRNTGLIEDRVCGPETRELLVALTTRDENGRTVSEVVESEFLLLAPSAELECGIGATRDDPAERLSHDVQRRLSALDRRARLILGDADAQANVCNRLDLEVFIHISSTELPEGIAAFYGREGGFTSVAGARLASALAEGVNEMADQWSVRTQMRRGPRLTRTRCPAVELELPVAAIDQLDARAVAGVIHTALSNWRTAPAA